MTRVHADDVEVERGVLAPMGIVDGAGGQAGTADGAGASHWAAVEGPVRFRWQQRWYAVRAVLDHWVEAGNWWQRAGASARAGGSGPAGVALGVGLGIDDGEREVWRVEATPSRGGRIGAGGVYDLRFEWGTGRWSLIRVHD